MNPPKVLISTTEIANKIGELGKQITHDYHGQKIVVLGVLKGSFIFMADLVRAIELPVQCEFIRVSSYRGTTKPGDMELVSGISADKIRDQHILVVEDIVDTGNTIQFLQQYLRQYSPKTLKICTLLLKKEMLQHQLTLDYVGFSIPSVFVLGYGLDVEELYRNCPYVGIWEKN